MKTLSEFQTYLSERGKKQEWLDLAASVLPPFWEAAKTSGYGIGMVRTYADRYIAGKEDAYQRIVLLFWYCDFNGDKEAAAYLVTLLGTLDVVESQRERLASLFGEEVAARTLEGLDFPPLGSDLERYPDAINAYLERMRDILPESGCQQVLAGNHHRLDPQQFEPEKLYLRQAEDFSSYLREKHARLVQTLQEHADSGKPWFEQYITQEVVDYVRDHQEIQTGVMDGDRIITAKIPYNPSAWLQESDPVIKRFHACHCPFVRASIPAGKKVSSLWCYCSGGFTKLLFDYLFDTDHEVELLESVLDGDDSCRFAIKLKAWKRESVKT